MTSNFTYLLAAGAFAGLVAALVSLMDAGSGKLPDQVIAGVNGSFIPRAAFERALNAVATDKRGALTNADRHRVLDRLIDEELLIQYGIRQGLIRSDGRVKSSLVQSVIGAKILLAESREIPIEQALEFFTNNRTLFFNSERLRVGLIRIPASEARDLDAAKVRAEEAADHLSAGLAFTDVQQEYHEGGALNLPDTLLPTGKLIDYLGPLLVDRAMALQVGAAAAPELISNSWQVVYLHERIQAVASDYDEVKELVLIEIRRREAENLLRQSLQRMRETEDIVISEVLL